MVIIIGSKKVFDKNPTFLYAKSQEETWNRRNIFQHNGGYIQQSYSQWTESIWIKIRDKTNVHFFQFFFLFLLNIVSAVLARAIDNENKKKRKKYLYVKIIWFSFIYLHKDSNRKPWELINTFCKLVEHRINIQKAITCLKTKIKKEILEISHSQLPKQNKIKTTLEKT